MDQILRDLIRDSWSIYEEAEGMRCLVRPSVPILFFGDSQSYRESRVKVVTVGLNPSRLEFPDEDRFQRFAAANRVYPSILRGNAYEPYVQALNEYFRQDPLKNWFDCYEYLLHGLDCSYYGKAPNTAIHTDICSPLPTDPTWKRLPPEEKSLLIRSGRPLWHSLIKWLSPDVIIVSVAREHVDEIRFPSLGQPELVYTVERKNPYIVKLTNLKMENGRVASLAFGQAAQKPFGTVSNVEKSNIGRAIKKYLESKTVNV
jgi:hypothetical protein